MTRKRGSLVTWSMVICSNCTGGRARWPKDRAPSNAGRWGRTRQQPVRELPTGSRIWMPTSDVQHEVFGFLGCLPKRATAAASAAPTCPHAGSMFIAAARGGSPSTRRRVPASHCALDAAEPKALAPVQPVDPRKRWLHDRVGTPPQPRRYRQSTPPSAATARARSFIASCTERVISTSRRGFIIT